MKILFSADGISFTQKALKFLVGNRTMLSAKDELLVPHIQDAISAQIERKLGSCEVTAYQARQTDAVLKPIEKFLDKHEVSYRCLRMAGSAAAEIVAAGKRERVQMFVMGAHAPAC